VKKEDEENTLATKIGKKGLISLSFHERSISTCPKEYRNRETLAPKKNENQRLTFEKRDEQKKAFFQVRDPRLRLS